MKQLILLHLLLVSTLLQEKVELSSLGKIKAKVIKFFKRKQNTKNSIFYLPSGHQFPGKNEDKLGKIRGLWLEYYDCLLLRLADLGDLMAISPKTVMVFEGTSARWDGGHRI